MICGYRYLDRGSDLHPDVCDSIRFGSVPIGSARFNSARTNSTPLQHRPSSNMGGAIGGYRTRHTSLRVGSHWLSSLRIGSDRLSSHQINSESSVACGHSRAAQSAGIGLASTRIALHRIDSIRVGSRQVESARLNSTQLNSPKTDQEVSINGRQISKRHRASPRAEIR